ncbi:MAG: hypothetical protein K2W33_01735 [Burkholderiales bacterium]|nr:hypothetical protein [Burkholderiales bacterium]
MNGAIVVTPPGLPALQLPRALAHLHARLLTLADADTVLAFRRQVLAQMPATLRAVDPARGLLPEVEQAWAAKHLGPRATTLALFNNQRLVAFGCLLQAHAQDPEDPGHLLNLAAPDWQRGAHMAACLVNEDYRGLHLQARLLHWRRHLADINGRTLLLGMTACGNTFSRRNMMGAGMTIRWIGEWRTGSWWYLLSMDLAQATHLPADNRHEWVALGNVDRQRELLASGYTGVTESTAYSQDRRRDTRLQFVYSETLASQTTLPIQAVNPPVERAQ